MEQPQAPAWVLLVYKIPREPTSSRALIWRKLKWLGALLLHDAVWVLPVTSWTREQLQWLAVEKRGRLVYDALYAQFASEPTQA